MTDTSAIVAIDEMEMATETYEGLIEAQEYHKAFALAENLRQRIGSVESEWRKKRENMQPLVDKIDWLKNREEKWKRFDKRVRMLKKHHPKLYEMMENILGRDLDEHIMAFSCVGNEKHYCGAMEENHRYLSSAGATFCSEFSKDAVDLHLHWFNLIQYQRVTHHTDKAFLKRYSTISAVPGRSVLHKANSCLGEGDLEQTYYWMKDRYRSLSRRDHNTPQDLCKMKKCFGPQPEICDDCGGPADKKGVCVLTH